MTSDSIQTETAAEKTGSAPEWLRELIASAHVVLFDFDGPICRLFARHTAEWVAGDLVDWVEGRGLHGLLTESERESLDPQQVLRAVDARHPGSDLVAELEERLTQEELRASASAWPTEFADPLIRTWRAKGVRLAITTNNSARAARTYLDGRGLMSCFDPHVYGRTQELHLLKPHPHCVVRALNAMGATPSATLMIGDSPTDFTAAEEAGVRFLGYARNDRKAKRLHEAGAEHMVTSLEPLLDVLRGRTGSGTGDGE